MDGPEGITILPANLIGVETAPAKAVPFAWTVTWAFCASWSAAILSSISWAIFLSLESREQPIEKQVSTIRNKRGRRGYPPHDGR